MNGLEQFSEERLKAWISDDPNKTYHVDGEDLQYLARIALSVKQAVPAGYLENGKGFMYEPRHKDLIKNPTPVYTTPPANCPAIPEGWKLVPIEPTEDMVVNGFESKPDKFFSPDIEWEAYDAMSGCEQAAHRAKLCWAAMLESAPNLE